MSTLRLYLRLLGEGALFALNALMVNRLRTFLSLLGITIGIFAIISVFTLVDTMENSVRSSFESLGDDSIFIERMPWGPEEGDEEYAWWKYMQRPAVTIKEGKALKDRMTTAHEVTFMASGQRTAEYRNSSVTNSYLVAASEGIELIVKVDILKGRYFTPSEFKSGKPLCILGNDVAQALFGPIEPIGKEIKVGGFRTTVIGVLEKEGQGLMGNGSDSWIISPIEYGKNILNLERSDTQIALKPKAGISVDEMENEVSMNMRSIRRLRPSEAKNFAVNKSSMLNSGLDAIFSFLNMAGLIIGGFSILVGGFSIANIMFVSVRERTPIIGIQKSLGAKRSFILFQFLFESITLCLLGGAIGLFLIYIITLIASLATGMEVVLSWENVLIGVGFSLGIGLISGIVPAMQASKMQPVEAIRANG